MIITQIAGGLGNQLFKYAVGRCLAHRLNTEFKVDANYYEYSSGSYHESYRLKNFNVQENFATKEEIESLPHVFERSVNGVPGVFNPAIFNIPDNIYLSGCFQSEKYFADIADIIRREFTLKNPLGKNSAAWRDKILAAKCAVSLHVRHGDYLTYESRIVRGLLPVSYYQTCINELRKDSSDITVFVFSDDMQWCKENLKFDLPTEFVEGCEHAFDEMHLMSLCKHNIISNSTFGWWGAWLNENPDKKVFVPNPWLYCLYWKDIVPDGWIKIPVDYSASTPKILSLIVYLQDNLSTVNLALTSLLIQSRMDYEIILVDASTDGTGQICRQIASDRRITILRIDPSFNKFAAGNKGIEIASGNYVMFLTCKDFIIMQASAILADIGDKSLKKYANTFESYMTYGTYVNCMPNIICATQYLAEDDGGEIFITEFPDKKFISKTDAALPNLNDTVELNLSAEQKLMGLAAKGVNNFVATKFFKRKFLADQKIRFNETAGGGMDAELLFLVNAFLSTEKITFVPQVFSGRLE